jgi:hypothetical protein
LHSLFGSLVLNLSYGEDYECREVKNTTMAPFYVMTLHCFFGGCISLNFNNVTILFFQSKIFLHNMIAQNMKKSTMKEITLRTM